MFFRFAAWHAGAAPPPALPAIVNFFRLHPNVLLAAIERFYATRNFIGNPDYSDPIAAANALPAAFANLEAGIVGDRTQRWDHIIYAYMIENTRAFEIFDRVLREYEAGERFETPDEETALWLRATEALFYRDLFGGSIASLTSWLRPDLRATRRNTYYRLLGVDLNHGLDGNRSYQFDKPAASNRDFVATFEAFLYEVWRGVLNASNGIGPNETDNAAIANHVRRLRDMLLVRRLHGNLLREEFWATVTMSWLHLTLFENTPVVVALKADAESLGERLRKIGTRVGIPSHSRADNYFTMAFEISGLLSYLEANANTENPTFAPGFYIAGGGGAPPNLAADIRTIITHWSGATGRDIKALRVSSATSTPLLVRDRSPREQPLPGRAGGRETALPMRYNGS